MLVWSGTVSFIIWHCWGGRYRWSGRGGHKGMGNGVCLYEGNVEECDRGPGLCL